MGCGGTSGSETNAAPYIASSDAPEVENLKTIFPGEWLEKPVLVADKGE
jgi:hypothetical protein